MRVKISFEVIIQIAFLIYNVLYNIIYILQYILQYKFHANQSKNILIFLSLTKFLSRQGQRYLQNYFCATFVGVIFYQSYVNCQLTHFVTYLLNVTHKIRFLSTITCLVICVVLIRIQCLTFKIVKTANRLDIDIYKHTWVITYQISRQIQLLYVTQKISICTCISDKLELFARAVAEWENTYS